MSVNMMTFLVVIGILIAFAPIAFWLIKRSHAKLAKLWPDLATVINGSFKGTKMTGTYQGFPVEAKVTAQTSAKGTQARHFFEIRMGGVGSTASDWAVWHGVGLMNISPQWHVDAKDERLTQQLAQSGAVAAIQRWGDSTDVRHDAGAGVLKYKKRIADLYALPTRDQFKNQLDLLMHLANFNRQPNAA